MSGKCYQNFQDTFSRQPCGTYIIYYCTPASYSRNSISDYYRRVATVAVYFMFLLWTALFRSPLKSRIVPHWNILPPARPSPLCFVRSYRKHLMVQLVPGILLLTIKNKEISRTICQGNATKIFKIPFRDSRVEHISYIISAFKFQTMRPWTFLDMLGLHTPYN